MGLFVETLDDIVNWWIKSLRIVESVWTKTVVKFHSVTQSRLSRIETINWRSNLGEIPDGK